MRFVNCGSSHVPPYLPLVKTTCLPSNIFLKFSSASPIQARNKRGTKTKVDLLISHYMQLDRIECASTRTIFPHAPMFSTVAKKQPHMPSIACCNWASMPANITMDPSYVPTSKRGAFSHAPRMERPYCSCCNVHRSRYIV
jgi:hypothetical protein